MSSENLNLLQFKRANVRLLHLTWFAFFLTFMVWFSHAPLKPLIMEAFDMSLDQWKALLILNVALTIPARIVVGMLVDRFGPRIVYSLLLALGGLMCLAFASAQTYGQLAITRFLLGFVGAGFVIGIRLVGEWFPARQVGLAEGVYGGWGNFGSAAAAFTLPTIALLFGGDNGWRYAIGITGLMAMAYAGVFYWRARNTPKGSTYFKPKKSGGLEVSSKRDFYFYLAMNLPMYAILAVLAWRLGPGNTALLPATAVYGLYLLLAVLFAYQMLQIFRVNRGLFFGEEPPVHDRYQFKQVAVLNWAYFVTFGSELAVVSMLPAFFLETFTGMSLAAAGALGAAFAFMNLVARPSGGHISDIFGRRRSLSIFIVGLAVGYFILSQVNGTWPVWLAVACVMFCSFFVQAGEGAVFAMVPLVKRRMTGQIAGMAGAYGNVGAVTFLTAYSFVDAGTFFLIIGASALVVLGIVQFLEEPRGHMSEINEDGTITQIELS